MNHTHPERRQAAMAVAVAAARPKRSVGAGRHAGSYSSIWRNNSTALCSMQSQSVRGKPGSHAMDGGSEEKEQLACAARCRGR